MLAVDNGPAPAARRAGRRFRHPTSCVPLERIGLPLSRRRVRFAVLLALAVIVTGASRPAAGFEIEALVVGAAGVRFHDARLRSLYGSPVGPSIALRMRGPYGLAPALGVQMMWKSQENSVAPLDAPARTKMLFVPVVLRVPFERLFFGRLELAAGPQAGWAYLHEDWDARVPGAGITADGRGNGSWIGAGVVAEARVRLGRAGAIGLAADWLWAAADRSTARGNRDRQTSMEAGWSALRLDWSAPWPGRP